MTVRNMPEEPGGPAKAQTIKQAKAAFKARGRPVLTEAEWRQLERNAQLSDRAESLKEREKKRAAFAKKQAEKTLQNSKHKIKLGSQLRCDRFGHKSSQFHLNKFFGGRIDTSKRLDEIKKAGKHTDEVDDLFGDDGVDDESLLSILSPSTDAIDGAVQLQSTPEPVTAPTCSKKLMLPPSSPKATRCDSQMVLQDFGSFLDELESGTQIARELNSDDSTKACVDGKDVVSSFGSLDFELTLAEIEELEKSEVQVATLNSGFLDAETAKTPAEAKPTLVSDLSDTETNPAAVRKPMPPPRAPASLLNSRSRWKEGGFEPVQQCNNGHLLKTLSNLQYNPQMPNARSKCKENSGITLPPALQSAAQLVAESQGRLAPAPPGNKTRTEIQHSALRLDFARPTHTKNVSETVARPQAVPATSKDSMAVPHRSAHVDFGFTMTQISDCFDDELQLTQFDPS